jgi:DedD protein
MAAAIILIPEMLSGPDRAPEQNTARANTESNVKTYTIDLADPPTGQSQTASQRSAQNPSEFTRAEPLATQNAMEALPAPAATPSESAQVTPEPAAAPDDEPGPATHSPPATRSESAPRQPLSEPARRVAPSPAPTVRPRAEESAGALASSASIPTTKGWAVQLGSFSSAVSAQRLANEFQTQGFDAFVMPVKSGATTLYRVRLGPMKDRAAAEGVLKRAKAKVAGAAIVAHP